MSHTDNTQQNFDTNYPNWLVLKLLAREDEQSSSASRQTTKQQWRREIEMDLTQ